MKPGTIAVLFLHGWTKLAGKTLAAVRGYRATFAQHFGYAAEARGLYGYSRDGTAYFKGEGDFTQRQGAPKFSIPAQSEDPFAEWIRHDPRPELYEFATELREQMKLLELDPARRERVQMRIRSYYDRLPEGIVHPSQIADVAAAVDRFVWGATRS